MNKPRIMAIICAALTLVFVFFVTRDDPVSSRTVEEVAGQLTQSKTFDTTGLTLRSGGEFKKTFLLSAGDYDGIVYYSADSIMDVRELLVIQLKDEAQAEPLVEVIKKRIEDKITLFNGYAPEEEALLGSYVLESSRGFVMFAVCANADKVLEEFKGAL